jgi:lysophospholipase L1-like esterase
MLHSVAMATRARISSSLLAVGILASEAVHAQNFALHNHDSVVCYGDSITAQRFYTKLTEEFVLTRYPALHVRFYNAGVPGDTVFGGYAGAMPQRVQRDVEPFHPTMITVMLGMNDGGWGYTAIIDHTRATVQKIQRESTGLTGDSLEDALPLPLDLNNVAPSGGPGCNCVHSALSSSFIPERGVSIRFIQETGASI